MHKKQLKNTQTSNIQTTQTQIPKNTQQRYTHIKYKLT